MAKEKRLIWIDGIQVSSYRNYLEDLKGFQVKIITSKKREEVIENLSKTDFMLITGSNITIDEEILHLSQPSFIQKTGVGYDIIDLNLLREKKISFCNIKGVNSKSVAELTLWLMLSVSRRLNDAEQLLRRGLWTNDHKNKMREEGEELYGSRVGLIGLGDIGRCVAQLLSPFHCEKIYYYKQRPLSQEEEEELQVEYSTLEHLLQNSHIVSLHLPLTPATRDLIGYKELRMMGQGAILINTSRGAIVNEEALIDSLKKGSIRGAGLDVFTIEPPEKENPLLSMKNTVVSPHVGSTTHSTTVRTMERAFTNLYRVARGERPYEEDILLDYFN